MGRRRSLRAQACLLAALLLALAAPAEAEQRSATRNGRVLRVFQVGGLEPAGDEVRVTGTGYDVRRGIYVSFCVDNGDGNLPGPCASRADGGTIWVSNDPPPFLRGLSRPWDDDARGTFDVVLKVRAQLDATTDCLKVRCAIVTRNDDLRLGDRGQDVILPIGFGVRAVPAAVSARVASPVARALPSAPDDRGAVGAHLLAGVLLAAAASGVGVAARGVLARRV